MDTLITQSIGFAAMAFCIGSYQCKTGRGLMLCKTVGDLLYVLHYLLLSSYSGCVTLLSPQGTSSSIAVGIVGNGPDGLDGAGSSRC